MDDEDTLKLPQRDKGPSPGSGDATPSPATNQATPIERAATKALQANLPSTSPSLGAGRHNTSINSQRPGSRLLLPPWPSPLPPAEMRPLTGSAPPVSQQQGSQQPGIGAGPAPTMIMHPGTSHGRGSRERRGPAGRPAQARRKRIILAICLALLVLVGSAIGYGYYYFNTNIQTPLTKFIHPVSRGSDEPPSTNNSSVDTGIITGRVWNILLLGSDNDGKYNFPAVLTQVMMVVHIDTVNNSVYLVSIPRDSWVYLPDIGGMHKIDQAFEFAASQHNNFDDGVREARLTIEKDYGITIDRYAWVGLGGFAKVIDTLGGVDIDVTHPIVDDTYPDDTGANANNPYAYKRLYLAPGPQHLNGLQALEFVRSRHADLVGDIGRTQRQQQVLQALKKKLNVSSVLSNIPQLIADMKGQIYTDLSEQEIIGFANYGRTLSGSAIHQLTLGPGPGSADFGSYASVYDPVAGGNQDVIIPNCANIQPTINQVFALGNTQSCNVTGG